MTSRSTASPSRLFSSAAPWILMRSTVAGFAPGTTGGTSVCTCAVSAGTKTAAKVRVIIQIGFIVLIDILFQKNQKLLFERDDRYRLRLQLESQLAVLSLHRDGF